MTINSEAPEVAEEAPAKKIKLSLVVILSVLLGILLTLGGVGAVLHFRASSALQAEILTIRAELKKKNIALDDVQAQVVALSGQMSILKDSAAARSVSASERARQAATATAAAGSSESKSPNDKEKSGTPELPAPPKVVKPKPAVQNCELVGKSPEDQATTLKRCVGLIDLPLSKDKAPAR